MGTKKTLRGHASDLADALGPRVESARDIATPVLADARDKAVPYLADARDKAVPYLADARDKAVPYLADAREKAVDTFSSEVLPAVTAALAAADEATEDARAEALKRSKAVAAALKGEVEAPKKKRHRLRNVLIALGLGGAAYSAYRYFFAAKPASSWQSSPPPAPAPAPPAAAPPRKATPVAEAAADDVAASDPAEAASDATEVPHDATTPDNPVTEVDVEKK